MANRQIRRPYGGVNKDAGDIPVSITSDGGIEPQRVDGEQDTDSIVDRISDERKSDNERDSGSIGIVEIDPEQLDEFIASNRGTADSGNPPKQRRKRGPNKRSSGGSSKAEETVAPFIMMAHTMMATFLKVPELMLEEKEAKQLSDAYSEFCRHHNVPVLGEKRMSEINLIAAIGMTYVPRFIAARNRMREEKINRARNITAQDAATFGIGVM